MNRRPFQHHRQSARRNPALKDNYRVNSYLRLASRIDGVKVRRIVIVEIHADHDAKETTDFRHASPTMVSNQDPQGSLWNGLGFKSPLGHAGCSPPSWGIVASMLPDFPEPKAKMRRRLTAMMKMAVDEQAPLAAGIKARLQVEGDAFSFETAEGKVETKKFKEISVKFEIPKGLSPQKTEEELAVKLKEVASSMARQTEGLLFSTLDGATKASGNAFDARGRPFHLSMFWDAVEKMDVDFDERGNAELPTIF